MNNNILIIIKQCLLTSIYFTVVLSLIKFLENKFEFNFLLFSLEVLAGFIALFLLQIILYGSANIQTTHNHPKDSNFSIEDWIAKLELNGIYLQKKIDNLYIFELSRYLKFCGRLLVFTENNSLKIVVNTQSYKHIKSILNLKEIYQKNMYDNTKVKHRGEGRRRA